MALRLLVLICLLLTTLQAIAGDAGREAAVLEFGHGAKALALGNAYTAVGGDVSSLYWNPAGLSLIKKNEVATLHSSLASDTAYYYLGGAAPLGSGSLGGSWVQLQLADIPETSASLDAEEEVVIENYLTYYENAVLLGYGLPLTDRLHIGVVAKSLSKKISDNYGYGRGGAASFGLLYQYSETVTVGAVADNLASTVEYDTGRIEHLPAKYRLGISWQLAQQWIWLVDVEKRDEHSPLKSFTGLECRLSPALYLAGGYGLDRLTAGAGIDWQGVYVQYAYLSDNEIAPGAEQFITLGVHW